jgi:chloramphenicol-sensitive protein RarD
MTESRRGVLFGASAYLMWGLFPLYWPLLKPMAAIEILSHRVVWSLAVVLALLAFNRRLSWLREASRRQLVLLGMAAVFISVNWGLYIWSVNHGHVVETSLGYFINPLVTVLLGVVALGERLRRGQWIALGLVALAVLGLSLQHGRPPWIALALAASFGLYGLLKKTAAVGAVESMSFETAVLFVPAAGYLGWLQASGAGSFGHQTLLKDLLLINAGLITAVPLLCFGAAANRIPLTTLGVLQYFAPTLQFLCGVLVFHEPMPTARLAGFCVVWAGLAVFTADALAQHRRALRTAAVIG